MGMMHNNLHVPRERDEEILRMLRLRGAGFSTREIGEMVGKTAANVRITTTTIRAADLNESGEGRAVVLAGYWE